jgi:hypothetical protein
VQERIPTRELAGPPQCIAIAARLGLLNEPQQAAMFGNGIEKSRLIARPHYDTHLLDAGAQDLIDQDRKDGPACAVRIHNRLQG